MNAVQKWMLRSFCVGEITMVAETRVTAGCSRGFGTSSSVEVDYDHVIFSNAVAYD